MGRVKLTRPVLFVALTALLATGAQASVPSTSAPLVLDHAQHLSSPNVYAALDVAALELLDEAPRFELGEVTLLAEPHTERFRLAGAELLSEEPRRAPPLSYPETRVRGFDFLGQEVVGVFEGVSLELHWGCSDFGLGFSEGNGVNLYAFVGQRPHEMTDPLGLHERRHVDANGMDVEIDAPTLDELNAGDFSFNVSYTPAGQTSPVHHTFSSGEGAAMYMTAKAGDPLSRSLFNTYYGVPVSDVKASWAGAWWQSFKTNLPGTIMSISAGLLAIETPRTAPQRVFYGTAEGDLIPGPAKLPKNVSGGKVVVPEGHTLSPLEPEFVEEPIVRRGPFTDAQREAFLKGEAGGTKVQQHHRGQVPLRQGGVMDELTGPGHPEGNAHTGQPRHTNPSQFNRLKGGNSLRKAETTQAWRAKGQRLVKVGPGAWIDPKAK
jgi:hypothetical protein